MVREQILHFTVGQFLTKLQFFVDTTHFRFPGLANMPVVLNAESQSRSATCLRTQVFHNLISELFHADSMICLFDFFLSEPRKFESQTNLVN